MQVETTVAEEASTVVKYSVKASPAQSTQVAAELDVAAVATGSSTKSALARSSTIMAVHAPVPQS